MRAPAPVSTQRCRRSLTLLTHTVELEIHSFVHPFPLSSACLTHVLVTYIVPTLRTSRTATFPYTSVAPFVDHSQPWSRTPPTTFHVMFFLFDKAFQHELRPPPPEKNTNGGGALWRRIYESIPTNIESGEPQQNSHPPIPPSPSSFQTRRLWTAIASPLIHAVQLLVTHAATSVYGPLRGDSGMVWQALWGFFGCLPELRHSVQQGWRGV